MKEIANILEAYDALDHQQVNVVLATVIKVKGSSYRSPGARMLITDTGQWVGSISGGCLEGDALRKARTVMRNRTPSLVTYDTREDESGMALGLGCNGIIDVLLEPVFSGEPENPITILKNLYSRKEPEAHALVYSVSNVRDVECGNRIRFEKGNEHVHKSGNAEVNSIIQERLQYHMDNRSSRTEQIHVDDGHIDVFMEVIEPPLRLLIFGGGFDVKPVTEFAARLGWDIAVTEECIAHAAPALFPDAGLVAQCSSHQILNKFEITPYTAAVVMSHNYKYDKEVLGKLLTQDIRYIGVLGPRSRFEKIVDDLGDEGLDLDHGKLAKVNSPIGLDIGAETPDEIAISIISEIKAVFSGRAGESLRFREEPIHERNDSSEEIYKPHLALE